MSPCATSSKPFLSAEWRYLVMLNYEVDEACLAPYVPRAVELDRWEGAVYLSMVGFRFLRTRVRGVPIPFHRDFDEVNLRFYVRREDGRESRRGVVFIKELVPKRAVAAVARRAYNENYQALPMRHTISIPNDGIGAGRAEYAWRTRSRWNRLGATFSGEPTLPKPESEPEFITEHYWGYAKQPDGSTVEYRVEHPRWPVWRAETWHFECDVESVYGPAFREALSATPTSAFIAEGSSVLVRRGVCIS